MLFMTFMVDSIAACRIKAIQPARAPPYQLPVIGGTRLGHRPHALLHGYRSDAYVLKRFAVSFVGGLLTSRLLELNALPAILNLWRKGSAQAWKVMRERRSVTCATH